VAGKQKGKEDNRYLWPEMLRVIRELKPHYVVGENVPGIINIAADEVCADLEREGYEVRIFNFEAAAIGAPHRRDRVAFVANRKSRDRNGDEIVRRIGKTEVQKISRNGTCLPWIPRSYESCICRVDDGLSDRVDRLKCLGNAVVPQQFYPIFKAIAELEGE
jgi:DNA (cytosine-5)-methyltransferase 1